tara:strand:+ start:55 stop:600 length:546 start_codon:yes stop_codon:yes gene_type:complete
MITQPQQPYQKPKFKSPFNVQSAKTGINVLRKGYGTYSDMHNILNTQYNPQSSYDPGGEALKKTQSAVNLLSTGGEVVNKIAQKTAVQKTGEKVATEVAKNTGGGLVKKLVPLLSIADATKTVVDGGSTAIQKTGAVLQGAAAVAATNFWNPAGWVAGALAVGGTLLQAFGGSKHRSHLKF